MSTTTEIRCPNCQKKIAEATGPTSVKCVCPRCRTDFEFSNIKKDKIVVESNIEK
ncbi:hypothetical protein [uncultured Winogradskyella sp.]|uniref:hypothetical protein n=1 Tax=uncultured Winogradskyella sp. TaxID=395353 RepID=UPI0026274E6A|nr:hypothetical protein [uncultured Winogradskyella sp.]